MQVRLRLGRLGLPPISPYRVGSASKLATDDDGKSILPGPPWARTGSGPDRAGTGHNRTGSGPARAGAGPGPAPFRTGPGRKRTGSGPARAIPGRGPQTISGPPTHSPALRPTHPCHPIPTPAHRPSQIITGPPTHTHPGDPESGERAGLRQAAVAALGGR